MCKESMPGDGRLPPIRISASARFSVAGNGNTVPKIAVARMEWNVIRGQAPRIPLCFIRATSGFRQVLA